MENIDTELLDKAVNISHGLFWLSDCPSVRAEVEKYIQEHPLPKKDLLATYVSIVCYFCHKTEMAQT